MAEISNMDIMIKLTAMDTTLSSVAKQAEKTNGRVNSIEDWKNGMIAVSEYKKENPSQIINAKSVTVQSPKWFQNDKLVSFLVVMGVSVASVVSFIVGGGGPQGLGQ